MTQASPARLVTTGIVGLDEVLLGGLPSANLFLVEGAPGTGKTTLALQFLLEGVQQGERSLYVTMAESEAEIKAIAQSHGWDITNLEIVELSPPDEIMNPETQYTVFHPSDVELSQTMRTVYDEVQRRQPRRMVIDSLAELRLLSQESIRLRRQILALKRFLTGRDCTVLLLDDIQREKEDLLCASIAHGVIRLESLLPDYGGERRRLRIQKLRGHRYRGGHHDLNIRIGGLEVFPRLVAADYGRTNGHEPVRIGNAPIDALTGGGLAPASSTLLAGPAGVGKSVLAAQYVLAAAERGENSAVLLFDEALKTWLGRARGLGMDVERHIEAGTITARQVDPSEVSPGEFAHRVLHLVEEKNLRMVVLDSISGYINAMPGERLLTIHLHELFSYLSRRGVSVIVTLALEGPFGHVAREGTEISYLADAIIMLRYFEAAGQVRNAISMLKKRGGSHEKTIREYRIDTGGLSVGEPLTNFRGVLTGVPTYEGNATPLLESRHDGSAS